MPYILDNVLLSTFLHITPLYLLNIAKYILYSRTRVCTVLSTATDSGFEVYQRNTSTLIFTNKEWLEFLLFLFPILK